VPPEAPESLVSSVGGEVLTDSPTHRAGTPRAPPVAPESPVSSEGGAVLTDLPTCCSGTRRGLPVALGVIPPEPPLSVTKFLSKRE
jgi:hypothetical protein